MRVATTFLVLCSAAFVPGSAGARGGSCTPGWQPAFGGLPGTNGLIRAAVVFDDGSGEALYVGGEFTSAGGVPAAYVARWDGAAWSALGSGVGGAVNALCVHDDGTGPALYAGGAFTTAGGVAASRVARWDGTSWSDVGGGTNAAVWALASHDDGTGAKLYAGGQFGSAGGVPMSALAVWNGTSWQGVGGGTNRAVFALEVFDDGGGDALYVGGQFTLAGGTAARCVARWDGVALTPLGAGVIGSVGGFGPTVYDLAVYDDGGGPALFAGGEFTTAGGSPAGNVACWDGAAWSDVGGSMNDDVRALCVFDGGSGPELVAGGRFTVAGSVNASRIARWNGTIWQPLGAGAVEEFQAAVEDLVVFDDGTGAALVACGRSLNGAELGANVARWSGADWSALGTGPNKSVAAARVLDLGTGPELVVGGFFSGIGDTVARRVARFDGTTWSAFGDGLADSVLAVEAFDAGAGPELYAGGTFQGSGPSPAHRVARFTGSDWVQLGTGLTSTAGGIFVNALAVYDDGGGQDLYVAGAFTHAAGVQVDSIARWDGSSWSALAGGGLDGFVVGRGYALAVYDDGTGPGLYVGGLFGGAGPAFAQNVARWDGSWSALLSGIPGQVNALCVHDDGGGADLYAGGFFLSAGGVPALRVARWDGSSWSALGSGMDDEVLALASFDDGNGPALFAAGEFGTAGGVPAQGVARWDGGAWSALGAGLGGPLPIAQALVAFDGGAGPALVVGGGFDESPAGDSRLALWGCPTGPDGFCFGTASDCPCGNAGAPGHGCDVAQATGGVRIDLVAQTSSPNGATLAGTGYVVTGSPTALVIRSADLDPAAPVVFGDGLRCIAASSLVRLTATTASGGNATHVFGHGAMAGAGTFHYQVWFRSTPSSFCDPIAAFSLSNGVSLTW